MSRNILITTTNTIENASIEAYLSPVSVHIVAGTGIFSDIAGGLRDIFGGRSAAYQKQLDSLRNEALEQLSKKAKQMGANAVIGLSIDMDEVSGGNKQMFMITAYGTAVKANIEQKEVVNTAYAVDKEDIQKLEVKFRLRREFEENGTAHFRDRYGDNTADFFYNFAKEDDLLKVIEDDLKDYGFYNQAIIKEAPEHLVKNVIYKVFRSENNHKPHQLLEFLKKIGPEPFSHKKDEMLDLLNFDQLIDLLNHPSSMIRANAVMLMSYPASTYTSDDIEKIRQVLSIIENENFLELNEIKDKMGIPTSDDGTWICNNNHDVRVVKGRNLDECPSCKLRRDGTYSGYLKNAKDAFSDLLVILEETLR